MGSRQPDRPQHLLGSAGRDAGQKLKVTHAAKMGAGGRNASPVEGYLRLTVPGCLDTNSSRKAGNSRSAQRLDSSRATSSETSRHQPSATLKPTTMTGLWYWPSSRSQMTISRSVSPILV